MGRVSQAVPCSHLGGEETAGERRRSRDDAGGEVHLVPSDHEFHRLAVLDIVSPSSNCTSTREPSRMPLLFRLLSMTQTLDDRPSFVYCWATPNHEVKNTASSDHRQELANAVSLLRPAPKAERPRRSWFVC